MLHHRIILHIALNWRRDLAGKSYAEWREDYLATRELRLEPVVWMPVSELRAELDRLAGELLRRMHNEPDDVDGREPLWMAREELRRRLAA
jgi:hypothetical protein